jgi:hypothetical protein
VGSYVELTSLHRFLSINAHPQLELTRGIFRMKAFFSVALFLTTAPLHALTYQEGYAKATAESKPLITFVGVQQARPIINAIVCQTPALDGYAAGQIVVSVPYQGKQYWRQTVTTVTEISLPGEATDALDEVNAARAARGLRPFLKDDGLTAGARAAARWRAEHLVTGHAPNDFAFLPPGSAATSAGCAAAEPSWGWLSCCYLDNWTYAGAAWEMGSDGRRYMHLFVR